MRAQWQRSPPLDFMPTAPPCARHRGALPHFTAAARQVSQEHNVFLKEKTMKVEKMKGSRRWLSWLPKALLATLLAGALAFVGCKSDSDDGDDDIHATKITLDQHVYPLSIASDAQKTVTLTATVEPENSTDTVIWESSNPDVAKVDNGIVTAVGTGDQESATATIKVTAGSVSDTCVITVYKAPIAELKDVTVTIDPVGEKTFDADSEEEFTVTATVTPENAPYGVEWHGIDDAVVGNTKNSTGNVHTLTLTGKKSGTLTIYATVGTGEDAQRSETLTLTVTKTVQDPGTVTPGDDPDEEDDGKTDEDLYGDPLYTQDFSDASVETDIGVQDANMCASEITADGVWRHYFVDTGGRSGARIAWLTQDLTEYTADTSYVLTFDAALTQMSNQKDFFLVSTTEKEDGNNMTSASTNPYLLYMKAAGSDSWTIMSGGENGSPLATVTLEAGKFYHYTLKVTAEGDSPSVLLTIKGAKDADGKAITDLPLDIFGDSYAAKRICLGVGLGTGAEQSLDNVKIFEYAPEQVFVTKVEILPASGTDIPRELGLNGSTTLTVKVYPDNATNKKVSWDSTNKTAVPVTVDEQTGIATVKGIAAAEAEITVTALGGKEGEDVKDSITITVKNETVPATSITITTPASDMNLSINKSVTFEAEVNDDASDKTVTWTSSNPSVATIDAESGEFIGLTEGEVVITATANGGENVSATRTIKLWLCYEDFDDATNGNVAGLFAPPNGGTFTVEDGAVRFTPASDGSGNRSVELSFNLLESEEPLSNVVVEFDAQFHEGSAGANCELQVALGLGNVPSKATNAALTADNGIVLVHATKPKGGSVAYEDDNKAEIPFFKSSSGNLTTPAWCHYKVVITAADDSYSAKLTVTAGSDTLCEDEAVPCAGIPSYLHLLAARQGSGVYLDNVKVYTQQ